MSVRSQVLLASASGALLALSFPKYGHPALGWIALAPLLVALASGSLARAFLLGLTTGVIYFAGTLYWMTGVMLAYGGFDAWAGPAFAFVIAAMLNAAFVAYVALYPALFAVVTRRMLMRYGPRALAAAPLVWVATELGRGYLFTGFPWVLLGYSQTTVLPIAQLASVTGVYGVSALVALVSASFAAAALQMRLNGRWRTAHLVPLAVAFALVVGVAVWGSVRVGSGELTGTGVPTRVGLVQGNVAFGDRTPARAEAVLNQNMAMTRQAIAQGAELVIWPESALSPYMFGDDPFVAGRLKAIAKQARVSILLGSDEAERTKPPTLYNSAFLVTSEGATGGVYRKMHLVPWGEYVPMKNVLFFVGPLVEAVSDFSKGTDATLLPVGAHRVSTAICYEVIYPDLVRQFVRAGSELLTTITNDAWFGRTSAPYQHFEQAAMRAIEEGRYLARAANTGVSGIVDPYGRVIARTDIYQQALVVGDARFLRVQTLYARMGDAFAYACAIVTVVLLAAARRRVK